MKERGILMSGPMVRATLDDLKNQTRRLDGLEDVNSYPGLLDGDSPLGPLGYRGLEISDYYLKPSSKREFKKNPGLFHWFLGIKNDGKEINPIPVKCPYGVPGDRLWVRETWGYITKAENEHFTHRRPDGCPVDVYYKPEAIAEGWANDVPWTPSIHMPRWASRLTLEIVKIRVERLQEISEEDCIAEGVALHTFARGCLSDNPPDPRWKFIELWNLISAKTAFGWDANPWVFVIEYKKL
jgi:hypothetical protein